MRGNQINRNLVDGYMLRLEDGGGIHTLSDQPGSFVVGNFIRTPAPAENGGHAGLYFDEGAGFYAALGQLLRPARHRYGAAGSTSLTTTRRATSR